MAYFRYLISVTFLILISVAALNVIVDPAGIYRTGRVNPQAYAEALVQSKYGLWVPENALDERLVAKALTKYASSAECVVIGSSHVMQISSVRAQRSLEKECRSILNLGVSGAGIEDQLTLAYLAVQNGSANKIIFGIDPWTFAFEKDQRWVTYKDDYLLARAQIIDNKPRKHAFFDQAIMAKVVNLISLEYTVRSFHTAMQDFKKGSPKITQAPKIDPSIGGISPAQLKDGSEVCSAQYIAQAKNAVIQLGGETYKTDGDLNQKPAIDAYRALIFWMRSKHATPMFLLTPYHENVWKSPESPNAKALKATALVVESLAKEMNVKVVGTYDPQLAGCSNTEFFDFMHPTASCLSKLR